MSQIQITGEAKIRDLQGPVVANSGVITALDGLPSQYVRGDGTLADIPSVTGGGSSVSYYLNGSVNQGTFAGSTYYQMSKDAVTGVGTNFSSSTDGLLAQFITDANDPDVSSIPSGNWNIEFYMGVSASSGALASFYVEFYKWNGSAFTFLASNVATPEFLTNTTTVDAYFTSVAFPETPLATTDRLAIRVYANVASKTVTMYTEDNRLCQIVTTFSKGLLSMNSLTDQEQYLTVGTAGTDFNIVSALDTHTFNIPSASDTNRGLITTGTQTIAGSKTFSSTATFNTGGVFNNWGISLYDGAGSTALSSSTLTGIYASKSGSITDIVISHNAPYDSILRFSNDVANFTYTFPDITGTIALLEGSQTFTGDKTFDGITNFDSAVLFNALQNQFSNGLQIAKTNTILRNTGYMTISANAGTGSSIKFSDGNSTYDTLFNFDNTGSRTYTFPASSGTVALTSNLSAYLPLTGGTLTGTLNGTFGIFSVGVYGFGLQAQGDVTNAGVLQLKHTGSVSVSSGNVAIAADSANTIGFYFAGSSTAKFSNASLTSTRTYTLPDASGTLALTSNLSAYVPYTGATGPVDLGSYDLLVNGVRAGKGGGTGSNNTRFGALAFMANTTGSYNAALGTLTLNANTTGANNTAVGNAALQLNTTGGSNTSVGAFTLTNNTTGVGNIALGTGSLAGITTGSYNIAIGINTANLITTGDFNTIIGNYSGSTNLTSNIILADGAGNVRYQWNGTNNVFGNAVQASAYRLTGMTAGSGALYWTSDRVTLANYNASGILTFEVNGGATALTIASTGAATFSRNDVANISVTIANAYINQGNLINFQQNKSGSTINAYIGHGGDNTGNFIINNGTQAVTITQAGNVGIGTSSPGQKLSVAGRISFAAYETDQDEFGFWTTTGSSGGVTMSTAGATNLLFRTNNTERMRITSNGQVLIGQTAASGTSNGIYFRPGIESGFIVTSDIALQLGRLGTTGDIQSFYSGSTRVGTISVSSTNTSYNTSSDYRLKEDFKDYDGLDIVSKIKTYDFAWKTDKSRNYGVIAHEIAEIMPYVVMGEKDGEFYQGVDYSKIVPVLVKAVQELSTELTELKALIAAK